ncbi:hypothetical protein V6N13_091399 [Hibiscus sabdariffa]|uniref:Bet v I/Major latex protein domain-containing protein n=1 Tax=Hibiscus sabdariffa TaxID=183260 RepID=A0ABR2QE60_9ROSI
MGVVSYDFEVSSPISPARLFKALVLEALMQSRALSSKEMVPLEPSPSIPVREAQDKDNLSYSYSLIEGGPLGDKLEKISYENKFEAGADGGSVCKSLMKFYTVGDCTFTEEEIKEQIQRMDRVYKAIEAYLLTNPDVCN